MGMQNLEVLRGSALWFWEVSCVKVVEICSNIEPVDAVLKLRELRFILFQDLLPPVIIGLKRVGLVK